MSAFRQPSRRRNIQTIPFPIFSLSLLRPRLLSPPRPTVICHLQNRCCSNFHVHVCRPLAARGEKGEKEKKEMGCCSPFLLLLRMQDISITGGKGGEIHSPSSSLFSGRRRQQHFGRFSEEEEKSRANMPRFPPFSSFNDPGEYFSSFVSCSAQHSHTTEHSTNGFRKKRRIGIERENWAEFRPNPKFHFSSFLLFVFAKLTCV